MNHRTADRGHVDVAAALVAVAAFAFVPWAFTGPGQSGLGLMLAGRWPLPLPVLAAAVAAVLAFASPQQATARLVVIGAGLTSFVLPPAAFVTDAKVKEGSCGDVCVAGPARAAACDACTDLICTEDAYCCSNAWDDACVQKATEICELSCN